MLFKSEGKIVLQISFQIKMKSVHFKDVYNYKDSDVWHKEEFSAKSSCINIIFRIQQQEMH